MKPQAFDYQRADTIADACQSMSRDDTRPLAGGQSLSPMLNLRLARPGALLDVSVTHELRGVKRVQGGVLIGASITHAEIEDGLVPDNTGGILPQVARGIAYRAVRSRGTIGGSLAHADPAADWATTLTAMNAQVVLQCLSNKRAERRRLYLDDFISGAMQTTIRENELLTAVFVPDVPSEHRFGYFKLCRKTGELAHAMTAVFRGTKPEDQRVVFGALPGAPMVRVGAEALDFDAWRELLTRRYPDMDDVELAMRIRVMKEAFERSKT